MKSYTANTNYTVVDRSPLHLAVGDVVAIGPRDRSWPGWIWASTTDGRGSYVPEDILVVAENPGPNEHGQATVRVAFSARDLSVRHGELVHALREVSGWLWCRNEAGDEGWLPDFVFRRVNGGR